MFFRQDMELVLRSRLAPGADLDIVFQDAARNPEGRRFRKIRGPEFYPLETGFFLEASLYRAHVMGSAGHRAIFAILKQEQQRRRVAVALFLSEKTRRAGFDYDFRALDKRLDQVVQDFLEHGLAGEQFAIWQDNP